MSNNTQKTLIEKSVKSDDVAKVFEKRHADILKSIRREIIHLLIDEGYIDTSILSKYPDITKMSLDEFKNLAGGNPTAKSIGGKSPRQIPPSNLAGGNPPAKSRRLINQYFIDTTYIDSRGKEYPRYELTRKGFDMIVLSLTGRKARQYKRWYIDEFHKKSEVVKSNKAISYELKENPVWLEFREQGKTIRQKFTKAFKDVFVPQREAEGKETNIFLGRYISTLTKQIYKKHGIETPKGVKIDRDTLDARQLFRVEQDEEKATELIYKYADHHYKEIYKLVKKELNL